MREAIRLLGCLVTLTAAFGLDSCTCKRTLISEEKSPSGDKLASVTTADCNGALGSLSTHVEIRPSNTPLWDKKNMALSVDAKVLLTLHWQDNQTLIVYGPKGLFKHSFVDDRIKRQRDEVDGVRMDYREL
jgi:hypothetical protein